MVTGFVLVLAQQKSQWATRLSSFAAAACLSFYDTGKNLATTLCMSLSERPLSMASWMERLLWNGEKAVFICLTFRLLKRSAKLTGFFPKGFLLTSCSRSAAFDSSVEPE